MQDKWTKEMWLQWQKDVIKSEWSKGGAVNVKKGNATLRKIKG